MNKEVKILKISKQEFTVPITITNVVKAAFESLQMIYENKYTRSISVEIGYIDSQGNCIATENYVIKDEYYSLLMSPSPEFAPGKLENEYREDDLWYFIDLLKAQKP